LPEAYVHLQSCNLEITPEMSFGQLACVYLAMVHHGHIEPDRELYDWMVYRHFQTAQGHRSNADDNNVPLEKTVCIQMITGTEMTRAQLLAIAIREAQFALRDEELLLVNTRPAHLEPHHATSGSSSSATGQAPPPLVPFPGDELVPGEDVLEAPERANLPRLE